MAENTQFNQRVREIGSDIFRVANASKPHLWQKSWWLEQMTHLVERDERLKTRAFQFVECLPTLRD